MNIGIIFTMDICDNLHDVNKTKINSNINYRHASWDWPGAYSSLSERPNICNAEKCLCPRRNRRRFNQEE